MKKSFFNIFQYSSFMKGVLILSSGTVLAQLINIGITPVITRVFTPEEFGIFSLYISIASIFTIVSTGRYELAIILPRKEEDAINLVFLSIIISLLLSLFVSILLISSNSVLSLIVDPDLLPWLYFIPLSVLVTGISQTFYYWNNRIKNYKRMSSSRIYQSLTNGLLSVGLGWIGLGVLGLVFAQILSLFISALLLAFGFLRYNTKNFRIRTSSLKRVLVQYKDMPLYNSFHAFLDMISANGILILISFYFGNYALGIYAFTFRILKGPLGIIGSSISQVFVQRATQLYHQNQDISRLILKIISRLALIALPIFIIIYFFGEKLFTIIFGESWSEAGRYAKILAPWLFFNFIVSPITQTSIILNKQKDALIISVLQTLFLLITIYITGYYRNVDVVLYSISVVGSITTIFFGIWIYLISRRDYIRYVKMNRPL